MRITPEQRANDMFLRWRRISDELAEFMGVPPGSMSCWNAVTQFVRDYILGHTGYNQRVNPNIVPDAKLAKLLRLTEKDEIVWLNLLRYLKIHFLKD